MRARWVMVTAIIALLLGACSSGPSDAALEAGKVPVSTTTTEAPEEGIAVIIIEGGRFRPSNLKMDLDETWIVEWRHQDVAEREYTLEARNGEFTSPVLGPGDVFEVDFSQFEPGIYRYFSFLGNNRIPGSVDTRPDQ